MLKGYEGLRLVIFGREGGRFFWFFRGWVSESGRVWGLGVEGDVKLGVLGVVGSRG